MTLGQIKKDLTVMDTTYDKGMLRLNISAAELQAANIQLHKPTAFDGLMQGWGDDPMWVAAPGESWGLTRDGMHEGVIKASSLGAFKTRKLILPEPLPKGADGPVKPIVEHFDMDGEGHTVTVKPSDKGGGVDIVMASTPAELLGKIDAAIAKCEPRVKELQAAKQNKSGAAAAAVGEEIPRVRGLKKALGDIRDDFAPRVKAATGTVDEQAARSLALDIAQAMIAAARQWKIKGLDSDSDLGFQSMQGLAMEGHEHDSFIYSTLVELGNEVAKPATTPASSNTPAGDGLQQKFETKLATARGEYGRACSEVTPTHDGEFNFGYAFVVQHQSMKGGGSSNYIFPASHRTDEGRYGAYGYQNFKSWTMEHICDLSKTIAEGGYPDETSLCIYLAAMVAEPQRNVVAEVTNRLVMGDPTLSSKQALHDNGQMPMAKGGTISDPADLSLDSVRGGAAKASGQVTDREIAMAKSYYAQATGKDLTADITERGETADTKTHIKSVLRSRFVDLGK